MKRFITNFSKVQEDLYRVCVESYNHKCGSEILSISEYATCGDGHLPDCSALYLNNGHRDLSEFWRLFESVQKAAKY